VRGGRNWHVRAKRCCGEGRVGEDKAGAHLQDGLVVGPALLLHAPELVDSGHTALQLSQHALVHGIQVRL
jgi:hypothetical protein